jgi:transcriptional regulator with XRE-family HTH domain
MTNTMHPVRAERLKQGLSQPELAERAGLARETVCRIETGRRKPMRATIKVLALALGVTPAELRPLG